MRLLLGVLVLLLCWGVRSYLLYEPPEVLPEQQFLSENCAEMMGIDGTGRWFSPSFYNAAVIHNPTESDSLIRLPCLDIYGFRQVDHLQAVAVMELDDYQLSEDRTSATLTRNLYYARLWLANIPSEENTPPLWYSYEQYPADSFLAAQRATGFHHRWAKNISAENFEPDVKTRGELLQAYITAHDIPLETVYYNGTAIPVRELNAFLFDT